MAAAVSPIPRLIFTDTNGLPLSGGKVYTYAAGTLTPKTFYSDESKSVSVSNPIILNTAGRPTVSSIDTTEVNLYYSGSAKFVVKDSNAVTIYTADNVEENAAQASITSQTGYTYVSPTINTSVLSASALLMPRPGGRLTLTTAVPVTTADVTAAGTLYYTPYVGNTIPLFDGVSTWTQLPFTEVATTISLLLSGKPYDVFGYNNSGTLGIRVAAWNTATARLVELTTQNGWLVRGTVGGTTDLYLGSFVPVTGSTTEDSLANRCVWNLYNQVPRLFRHAISTASWAYATSATIRQANASAANQCTVCVGYPNVLIDATETVVLSQDQASLLPFSVGIGFDSTTAYATSSSGTPIVLTSTQQPTATAKATIIASAGYHTITQLEAGNAAATATFYGTGTYANSGVLQGTLLG